MQPFFNIFLNFFENSDLRGATPKVLILFSCFSAHIIGAYASTVALANDNVSTKIQRKIRLTR